MIHLSWPPPNMNMIGEVCDSHGTTSLTSFDRNHLATGWLRWTRPLVRGGIISNHLFDYTGLECYGVRAVGEAQGVWRRSGVFRISPKCMMLLVSSPFKTKQTFMKLWKNNNLWMVWDGFKCGYAHQLLISYMNGHFHITKNVKKKLLPHNSIWLYTTLLLPQSF